MTDAPAVADVALVPVTADNWRSVARVRATDDQLAWVAEVTYYLCVCAYGDTWHLWLIEADGEVVGFLMWGVDDDQSRWLGGFVVDAAHQRRGIGRAAAAEAVRILSAQPGCTGIALSVDPTNEAARKFYRSLGFEETGETEDDELVMRRGLG